MRQPTEQRAEGKVILLHDRRPFFEMDAEIVTRSLGISLGVCVAPLSRYGSSEATRWGEEKSRDDAANDRAVKGFVLRQVGQNRKRAAPRLSELDGTLPKSVFEFVEIGDQRAPANRPMMTIDSGSTRRRTFAQRSSVSFSVGP